jgi:hypothetical protein
MALLYAMPVRIVYQIGNNGKTDRETGGARFGGSTIYRRKALNSIGRDGQI